MAANLITYADGVVSPFLDGIMQELYTSGGGVITGGTITISGASTLHITQTHGALCGREFSIDEGDYSVPLSSSGTKLGRIYLHMDLANTAAPLEVLIETGASLTPVVQDDDVNETDGTYEINLATFEVDESTIKNLSIVAPSLKTLLGKTLQTINDCALSTDPQDIAGAAALSALNSKTTKYTLLWTNPNPTADYAGTTLPIDISGYDEIKIVTNFGIFSGNVGNSIYGTIAAPSGGVMYVWSRIFTLTNTAQISIANCNQAPTSSGAVTAANGVLIPIKIFGVKIG